MPTNGEVKHNAIVESALTTIAKELAIANKLKEVELFKSLKESKLDDDSKRDLYGLLTKVMEAEKL